MPIRPENRHRYPPRQEWQALRAAVLERAGGRCECVGECGLHCTTPPGPRRCNEVNGTLAAWARGQIVLTIAHLDHQPENNDLGNLRAFCQRCHLRYDARHHAATASATRDRQRGQGRLL